MNENETEFERLWSHYLAHRDDASREKLLPYYTDQITFMARRVYNALSEVVTQETELDILINAGHFGCWECFPRFDPERKTKFLTFMLPRVRGSMLDIVRKESRLSRKMVDDGRKGKKIPSTMSIYKPLVQQQDASSKPNDNSDYVWELADIIKDYREAPVGSEMESEEAVARLLRGATKDMKIPLKMYLFNNMTMREVGRKRGLSESRISQLNKQTLLSLKKYLRRYYHDCLGTDAIMDEFVCNQVFSPE